MRFFKITPDNNTDAQQIFNLISTRRFYPNDTTTPALPPFDPGNAGWTTTVQNFDYRQFFVFVGHYSDGSFIIYTREDYTVGEFNTNVIPSGEWTSRYNLSVAPTIEEFEDMSYIKNYRRTEGRVDYLFLEYDYQNVNNFEY